MKTLPKISIIIPVYKCEKYLKQCVDSVLAQTFEDFELILVDDGSPDGSPEICDVYAKSDQRVLVIHKENGGVSSARNKGIETATGEYIMLIDSDDYIDCDLLQCAYDCITDYNVDLFISGLVMEYWENNAIIKKEWFGIEKETIYTLKDLLENVWKSFPQIHIAGPCCKLYKREIIKNHAIDFDITLDCGEDTYFNLGYLRHTEKIFFSDRIFYHYRRESQESLFSRFHKNTYEIHNKVYGEMRELMLFAHCSQEARTRFENAHFHMLIGGIHEYFRFYNLNTYEERQELVRKIGEDDTVRKYKLGMISGIKYKILLILLKMRRYNRILKIFEKHYKK